MTMQTETEEHGARNMRPAVTGRLTPPFFRGATRSPAPNEMRDHLANVRTFLAWVRTAITIMAFGFVVAKFGLLLRELPGSHVHPGELHLATIIGSILVLLGAVFLFMATLDFLVVKRQIEAKVIAFSAGIHIMLAGVLIVIAVGVAMYIWITAYA
jgi:inner membrane protein YidH